MLGDRSGYDTLPSQQAFTPVVLSVGGLKVCIDHVTEPRHFALMSVVYDSK